MSMYKLSKDYTELFRLICSGETVAAFVDYVGMFPEPSRDICKVRRIGPYEIMISARGMQYGCVCYSERDTDGYIEHELELALFEAQCERLNLEWIAGIK